MKNEIRKQALNKKQEVIKMKINLSSTTKLQDALDKVQEKSRERNITVTDIIGASEEVYKHLNSFLPKKYIKNCTVVCNLNAFTPPNAYKGIPQATCFTLVYSGSGWFVTSITRAPASGTKRFHINLTDEAKLKLAENFSVLA